MAARLAFVAAVMAGVVWLLLNGRVGEAVFVVILAVWLRRAAESGRIARLAKRATKPS